MHDKSTLCCFEVRQHEYAPLDGQSPSCHVISNSVSSSPSGKRNSKQNLHYNLISKHTKPWTCNCSPCPRGSHGPHTESRHDGGDKHTWRSHAFSYSYTGRLTMVFIRLGMQFSIPLGELGTQFHTHACHNKQSHTRVLRPSMAKPRPTTS
jgi:hypothetical protein